MDHLASLSSHGEPAELWSDLFLQGGGQCGHAIRAIDWTKTPLGAPADWPGTLKTAVSLMLNSAGPIYIGWSRDLLSLYNDGYLPILGDRPPGFGKPFRELWPEIWGQLAPLVTETMAGKPQHFVDLPIAVGGRPDIPLGYFTFSYTPLRDANGEVAGFYCAATETTAAVRARQVDRYLLELNQVLQQASSAQAAKVAVAQLLGTRLGASRVLYAEPDLAANEFIAGNFYTAPGVAPIAGRFAFPPAVFAEYARGLPIVLEDYHQDSVLGPERDRPEISALAVRAVLDIPLVRNGELLAVLSIHHTEPRRWSTIDIELATATAARSWDIVERARAEEQLRRSEEQFRSTAEAVPGLLFVTDNEGRNLYVNRFYRDYIGRSDALADWGWRDVVHPDDLQSVLGATAQSRATGEDFQLDYRIRRHDGEFHWHSTKASPTRNESGKIFQWVGVSLDIHDQRLAEEQALAAAEEIGAIYASAPVGLTVVDRDLRYIRINDRLAEMNGIPAADHIGKTIMELLPDVAATAEAPLRRVLEGEEIWGVEITGQTPAMPNVTRTWRENWLPVRSAGGEVIGVAISAEEVTSQKAAQVALAASEAQFRTLAEALPGMLFITTAEGANSYVNETFAHYSGLSKNELLGTGWAQLLHPDDVSRTWDAWQGAVATSRPYEVEYRLRRHDGEYRWFATRALPIPAMDTGSGESWVGTCIDIHDRKLVEQEMQAAESRYRAVFEQAGVGVGRVSPDGSFLEINDRFCQILRRSRDDLLGQGWNDITHPDDLAADLGRIEAMSRGEINSYSVEKRYLAPEGGDIWVNLTVATQRDARGKVQFFIPVVEDISARKSAEAALRSSEERYRTLFESMEQGFCAIQVGFDEDGNPNDFRLTELNPAFTRQSGLGQDLLGRSLREAVPDLEQSWFDRYGEVVKTGQSIRFVDHAEPLGRWFEVYAFPIGVREQQSLAILFSDVTERVEKEATLRRSEQELRLRLNAIPQMVWSTLPNGYHDFYNDRWYEFTGTPLGSTDGEGWNGMFHPDDQPRAMQAWKESLATGQPYEIEYRLRHHDGTYRWVLGRALPIRDNAATVVRWMGTCTDIDGRIQATRALQESEARLRAVIEAMPVGLVFADAAGAITGGNRRVNEILGHKIVATEQVSDYSHDYVAYHADGRQVQSDEYPLAKVVAGAARAKLECKVQRGDGGQAWVRYEAAPIFAPEGRIIGGVVASLDIDREKRLTESLEREVEKVIAEREAAQEALRQSQKLEAMGQLTGGVAHDFNNLLTPIIGSLDLLQRKQILDERTGRLVDGALASAEKARVLVQRLLAFARRQPLKPQPIDLKRVVEEMSELIDSTSGPRIRVLTDVEDELPPALADGNQLEMALLNLSVNARDAMPEGGTLTIAARTEQSSAAARLGIGGKAYVVLSVSDTGLGMDEETRRRAIEPFFSTKGVGKGTGLGLSMVHGLAAQLGGALDIRSAPGMGTTIELWLPMASGAVAGGSDDSGEAEAHGAGTVLLVDDEELVRASTAGMLADLGYRVLEADSGEAALLLVDGGAKPELLVTDQLMPGLSGTDLAIRLRERFAGLPVLIVSGYADLESLSPTFPHLSKPFRQAELAAALEKVTP
jgi:PAS domain S-box-containing protein